MNKERNETDAPLNVNDLVRVAKPLNPDPDMPDDYEYDDLVPEKDWIKPDSIARHYSREKTVPRHFVTLFGSQETRELQAVMNDPALQELDSLLARKELDLNEASEYAAVLPEHQAIRKKLDELARRCVASLKNKNILKTALNKSITSHRKKPGIFNVGKALGLEVFAKIDALADNFIIEEGFAFRNSQVNYLKGKLHEYLVQAIFRLLSGGGYSSKDKEEIHTFLRLVDNENAATGIGRVFARMFFDMIEHFDKITRNTKKDYFKEMTASLEAVLPASDVSDSGLSADNAEKFSEIRELLEIEKPSQLRRDIGQSKLLIAGKRYRKVDGFRLDSSCIVRLLFGPDAKYVTPRLMINEAGNYDIEHFLRHDSVELYLDRFNGELCYCMTNLPVRPSMSTRDYLLLQSAVFNLLSDHFNGREITPVASVIRETRDMLNPETAGGGQADLTGISHGPESEKAQADEGTSNLFAVFRRMRGLKGNTVLAALRSLLGKPIRINGSHHIFKGMNGLTYPIPLHGDDQVGLGILKKCLKMWNIQPDEFLIRVKG